MSDITAVIGSYESASLLPGCIASLRAQTLPPTEIVVVDGASTDGSAAVARSLGATVVDTGNRGLGHLYNRGAGVADGRLVLLANPDTAFEPNCLELLADALLADGRRFAADPRQVEWDGGRTIHERVQLEPGSLRDPIPWHRIAQRPSDVVVPTLFANAGGMLVRLDRLRALGGFDEGYFLEYEDFDLCARAARHGWISVYVPDAVMRHRVGGATPERAGATRLAASHVSVLRLACKLLPARSVALVLTGELLRALRRPHVVGPALVRTARDVRELRRLRRELAG